jgi:hypothetical protein
MRAAHLTGPLLVTAVLVACGGDEQDEQSSKQRYRERANAICADLGRETARLAEGSFGDLSRPPSRARARRYEQRARALAETALADLRALPAPGGDEARVARIWAALEAAIDELAAVPVEDPGGAEPGPATRRFEREARAYGLDRCAGAG